MKSESVKMRRERTPNVLGYSYLDLCSIDTVKVELVPEKKGLILKHVEYEVTSQVSTEFYVNLTFLFLGCFASFFDYPDNSFSCFIFMTFCEVY